MKAWPGGADAVLAASIFHFGEHTVGEARDYLAARRAGSPGAGLAESAGHGEYALDGTVGTSIQSGVE